MEDGTLRGTMGIQHRFLDHAQRHLGGENEETDWILENWAFTLDALEHRPELLLGGVDWISKKWLLEMFREKEGLTWQDPWLQSLDLEYHNIDPEAGLFFALEPAKRIGEFNDGVRRPETMRIPPPGYAGAGPRPGGRAFPGEPRAVPDQLGLGGIRRPPLPGDARSAGDLRRGGRGIHRAAIAAAAGGYQR